MRNGSRLFLFVADHTQQRSPVKTCRSGLVMPGFACQTFAFVSVGLWLACVAEFARGSFTGMKHSCFGNASEAATFVRYYLSVEEKREANMTDPSLTTDEQRVNAMPKNIWAFPDDDDDEDDADADDDDIPEGWQRVRWLSRPDFGSPEWWSRT